MKFSSRVLCGLLIAIVGGGLPAVRAEEPVPLEVKIGQMVMVGFRGLEAGPNSPIVRDIQELHLGGVVLFDYDVPLRKPERNIQNPAQLKKLISDLKSAAAIPLLVAVDQEGGRVNRLKERFGFPATVSAQYLGSQRSAALTAEYAERTATLLRTFGFNLNFAPVLDLNVNPDNPVIGGVERSFSSDPAHVEELASIWIKAHRRHGILSTVKHFPGHGSSEKDSHEGFVNVTETWSELELQPYQSLISKGSVDLVMTAHIFNSHWDRRYPATLSRAVLEGLLRSKLGFDGVIVSDDMQMKAITSQFGLEVAIETGIQAGLDLLVFSNNTAWDPEIARKVCTIIQRLVAENKIPRERIDASYRRITALKEKISD